MFTDQPRLIDTPERFGLAAYPYRCELQGVGVLAEGLVKLVMLPAMIASPVLFIAMVIGLTLLPAASAGLFISLSWLGATLAAAHALLNYRTLSYYDKTDGCFYLERWRLGKHKKECWDRSLFRGISIGYRHSTSGRSPTLRLHAKTEGFLLDNFLRPADMHYTRQLAAWLSHYSQLPQLPEQGTGSQHDLNDLRNNAWLTKRMASNRNGSNDAIAGTSPPQAADLPAIGQPPVQDGGRMTIRFVYLLSLTCLAGFVIQLNWHLQSQSLWSAISTYRWGYVFTLAFPALTLYILIRDRLHKN